MKSEPDVFSWDKLVKDKRTKWDGVRNYQANNNMKAMKRGDHAFFYHSNEGREIVGIMKVVKNWHRDPKDKTGHFGFVDVVPMRPLARKVSLATIKNDKQLKAMALLRQGRLSVSPVSNAEWNRILELAEA